MTDNKRNRKQIVCIALILLNLGFIWGNSMLPGKDSSQISGGVLELVEQILGDLGPRGEFFIRKLGHFSEFACLGMLLTWLFRLMEQKGYHSFTMPLLCGILAALVDETIQISSPGRGPSVVDVWIDTGGAAAGILILLLGALLLKKGKHHVTNGGK